MYSKYTLFFFCFVQSVPEGNVIFIQQKSDIEGKATAAKVKALNVDIMGFISRDPLSSHCRCYSTALQETKRVKRIKNVHERENNNAKSGMD